MIKIIRVCTFPTDEFNTVGLHCYQLHKLEQVFTYYASPPLKGEDLYFTESNAALKRYDFFNVASPKRGGFFRKLLFVIRRLISIIKFSIKVIWSNSFRSADIVHIHSLMYYPLALWGKLLGCKVYLSFHGEDFNRIKELRFFPMISKIFDGLFAISPHMVPYLENVCSNPVYFIGNGVDLAVFHNKNLKRDRKIIFVASFKPVKRHDLIIESFDELLEQYPELQLDLVGSGDLMPYYKNLVETKRIKNINFLGQKTSEELCNLYNTSEIFCLTSDSEGFPKVVLEALACGCRIVSTKVGSVPQIFGDEYPYYIQESKKEEAKVALALCLDHPEKMKPYLSYIEEYTWEEVINQYQTIYKSDLCIY